MNNKTVTTLIIIGFISAIASLFMVIFGIIAIILCVIALVKNSKINVLSGGKKWLAYISIILATISIIYTALIFKDQITGFIDNAKQEFDIAAVKSRDARRLADAKIFNITIQLYTMNAKTLPTAKNNTGNFKTWKLTKNSADFTKLLSTLKSVDSTLDIPADPLDPDRSYEYFSDGEKYTVRVFFESDNKENCQPIKQNYCEYEITGSLAQIINQQL